MKHAIAIALCLALAGCAEPQPRPSTPSGNVEYTLSNVKAECVRASLMNELVNNGVAIRSSNESQIVAGKITNNVMEAALLGSRAGGAPEDRIMFTMIQQPNGSDLRIVVIESIVTNPGTGLESVMVRAPTQANQGIFENWMSRVEATCRPANPATATADTTQPPASQHRMAPGTFANIPCDVVTADAKAQCELDHQAVQAQH